MFNFIFIRRWIRFLFLFFFIDWFSRLPIFCLNSFLICCCKRMSFTNWWINRHVVPWKRKSLNGINWLMDKSVNEGENSMMVLYSEGEDSIIDGLNRWKSANLSKGISISCFSPSNQSRRNLYRWIWIGHSF